MTLCPLQFPGDTFPLAFLFRAFFSSPKKVRVETRQRSSAQLARPWLWQQAQHEHLGKKHLSIISVTVSHLLWRYSGESHYKHKNIFSGKGSSFFLKAHPHSLLHYQAGQRHLHAIYMSLEQLQAPQTSRAPRDASCCTAAGPAPLLWAWQQDLPGRAPSPHSTCQ